MKYITSENLGAKLKRLRQEVGLEQEIVAKILEIPRSAMTSIEQGTREISAMQLIMFCKIYRIPPNDLLNWPKYQTRQHPALESHEFDVSSYVKIPKPAPGGE